MEDDKQVVVFSAVDGKDVGRPPNPSGKSVLHMSVSPSGHRIITSFGPDSGYQLWDTETRRVLSDDYLSGLRDDRDSKFLTDEILHAHYSDGGGGGWSALYRPGQADSRTDGRYDIRSFLGGELLLDDGDQVIDGKTLKRLPPPAGRRYHPGMAKTARDGRFVYNNGWVIDTRTEKRFELHVSGYAWSYPGNQPAFYPSFGSVAIAGTETRILPVPARLDISPALLQLWAQVVVRGELGPEGTFVKWDEATWEKKRQKLAAMPVPYADFPFPGYVATDKLHWLRAEYEAAAEKDKLRLANELLRQAEASGDKVEAAKWRAERAKFVREVAPPPREVRR